MTENEKQRIQDLRRAGRTLIEIADRLSLSISSIKTYCSRNNIRSVVYKECLCCGKALVQMDGHKRRKFCCKACKDTWWNRHRSEVGYGRD